LPEEIEDQRIIVSSVEDEGLVTIKFGDDDQEGAMPSRFLPVDLHMVVAEIPQGLSCGKLVEDGQER
jgi:hypothetical protein